jgi:L-alanine-DL-glutamate epimerase-like enolase superfamily enzyme
VPDDAAVPDDVAVPAGAAVPDDAALDADGLRITAVEPFILHVPVTKGVIADSTHRLSHWGAPGVRIHTAGGSVGTGYTGTHAHLASDRLVADCAAHTYGPLLIGRDPRQVRALWLELQRFPPAAWLGRSGLSQLALAAIDVALWDLKAQAAGAPLWHLLGGSERKAVEAYDTDGGWLNWPDDVLVDECRRAVLERGYRAVKIKVGSDSLRDDLRRIEAVRRAIGDDARLMVDANGRLGHHEAMRLGHELAGFDVAWFEEPTSFDDVAAHARLARTLSTPIALGEQLSTTDAFRDFVRAEAVDVVQADAVRLAGVTEWWTVADLAFAHRLPVVPHIGDMMQVHLHLAIAHPACTLLEHIPWLRDCFVESATVRDGHFVLPQRPGAGTALRPDALERYGVR